MQARDAPTVALLLDIPNCYLAVRINARERLMIKISARLFTISTTIFTLLIFTLAASPASASSGCESLKGCDRKFCEIKKQIDIAQEKRNYRRADGIKTALEKASLHCTDEGLRQELAEEIMEAEEDLAEYEADLKEAEKDGDMDDLRKYQKKIDEESSTIEQLKNELSNLN